MANSDQRETGLRGSVGWLGIVFFVVAAAAPLTVVFGSLPPAISFGGIGIPGAVIVAGIVLILFAFGFTAMSRYVRNAGAFYAYASRGIGKPVGIGVALVALVSYAVLSIAFYGLIGFFGNVAGNEVLGVDLPWWIYSAVALVAILLLSNRQVDVGAKVLGVLLTLEILIVVVLMISILVQGGPEPFSMEPFSFNAVFMAPGAGILFVFAFGAYLGFEATAVFSEEAQDAERSVPRATYVAVGFLAIFYAISFAIIIYGFGVTGSLDIAADPESAQFLTLISATTFLGDWGADAMLILVVTSFFACLLSFHNATSRYLYSLGREGLLPRGLGKVNAQGAPLRGSLVLIVIATIVIVITAITGTDPYFGMAIWAYSIGVAGLVLVQALAAFSVVGYFGRDRRGHNPLRVIVAPLLGAIGLTIGWIVIVMNFSALSGTEGSTNLWLILPAPVLLVVGIVWGLIMKSSQRARYDALLSADI
jgi:amino acid transporter